MFYSIHIAICCSRRSSLYMRSEILYLTPLMKSKESYRHCIAECLERSAYECGRNKQHSGFGVSGVLKRRQNYPSEGPKTDHLSGVYRTIDASFTDYLQSSTLDSFPVKRLYNACQIYSSVWAPRQSRLQVPNKDSLLHGHSSVKGKFPYVDDRVAVLSELTKATIMQSRHRVNSESHPKWALRTIRRRRRKLLVKAKRRSIAQEATRVLQAKLLANQKTKKT